jgi:hypothetical protein
MNHISDDKVSFDQASSVTWWLPSKTSGALASAPAPVRSVCASVRAEAETVAHAHHSGAEAVHPQLSIFACRVPTECGENGASYDSKYEISHYCLRLAPLLPTGRAPPLEFGSVSHSSGAIVIDSTMDTIEGNSFSHATTLIRRCLDSISIALLEC